MPLSCAECYAENVPKAAEPPKKYFKAAVANYLLSFEYFDYVSHGKHPLNGGGLTPMPEAWGGAKEV